MRNIFTHFLRPLLRPQSLSLRLLSAILLCSTLFTILATCVQLFIDFRKDVAGIHQRVQIIEETYLDTLAASAFALDTTQLTLQLQGILKLPDIEYLELVEVENGQARILSAQGHKPEHADIYHQLKLPYPHMKNTSAHLKISASLDGAYRELWDTLFVILISNTIKTFTAAFFIFLIIHHIVIRHLHSITVFAENAEIDHTNTPLQLQRTPGHNADDLDRVTNAINDMRRRLSNGREERERMYAIIEATTDIVVITSPSGYILYINQAGKDLLQTDTTLIGQDLGQFYRTKDPSSKDRPSHTRIKGNWHGDSELRLADGSSIAVHEIIMSHKSEHNEVEFLSTIIRDVSKQKLTEQRLRQSEKMDSIGQLAGGIAHDFNNMLGGIMGGADLLRTVVKDDARGLRYIDLIMQSAERAAELTKKMLTFARKSDIQSTKIDIHAIINESIELLERSINKNITIQSTLSAESHTVIGDAGSMVNIIINLCINSSHAMPNGGTLSITSELQSLSQEDCAQMQGTYMQGELQAEDYIVITLSDTGYGMSTETLRHIFEPFFTTKEVGKGTGLGLAAVYGSIQDMNGCIDVHSTPEQGSDFTIYIPIAQETTRTAKETLSATHAPIDNELRVLVIDDEDLIREMTLMTLEHLGYAHIGADDGINAIHIYKEQHSTIDCIIIDLIMPHMNGYETYLALKEINPQLKVIITSGYSSNVSLDDLRAQGVQHFLSKPYGQAELQETLEHVLAT